MLPEEELNFEKECLRLNKIMDRYDCVNIFLSEGAGMDLIIKETEKSGKTILRDAFGHVRLDEINPGDYVVQVWIWDPKKGKSAETLEALEEAKLIFEKHGFLIDLWQHGLGSKNFYQFVMLSNSREAQAKSLESLENDTEWQRKQLEWFDEEKYGKLVESYQVTSLQ